MKKFNIIIIGDIILWIIGGTAAVILYPTHTDDIQTQQFCAYGEVYVEFQQGNKVWGTTFLNERGKPVACSDNETSEKISPATNI